MQFPVKFTLSARLAPILCMCFTLFLLVVSSLAFANEQRSEVVRLYRGYQNAIAKESYEDALSFAKKAYRIAVKELEDETTLIATLEHNLANAYHATGDFEAALEHFHSVENQYLQIHGESSYEVASLKMDMARTVISNQDEPLRQRLQTLEVLTDSALDTIRDNSGADSLLYAQYLVTSAQLFSLNFGSKNRAILHLNDAFSIANGHPQSTDESIGAIAKELVKQISIAVSPDARQENPFIYFEYSYKSIYGDYISYLGDVISELELRDIDWQTRGEAYKQLRFIYILKGESAKAMQICRTLLKMGDESLVHPSAYPTLVMAAPKDRGSRRVGKGELEFEVDEGGRPKNIVIVDARGSRLLLKESITAVEQNRYVPKCDGKKYVGAKGVRQKFEGLESY